MNAVSLAKTAYGSAATPVRTARGTEYALFAEITRRLKSAIALGPKGFAGLAQALHENRRLWRTLAINVADGDNALPQSLRAQIFYLYEFVDHQTSSILAGESTADALLDINTAIMRGLASEGPR